MNMHTTTGQTSSSTSTHSASSTSTTNIGQYHYPPISTLRRPSRPSNIDLSVFDINNSQQSNDPGIYSAPICHVKQTNNNNHHHHMTQSSLLLSPHPHTATFHYQPQQQQQQQQHIQLSSHHHQQQQHNVHQYQQPTHHHQQQQQQQQHILDPFSQHPHTPHTFPLQASSNHYHQYFHFPPSTQNLGTTNNSTPPAYNQITLQANVTTNGHHSPLNHRQNPVSSSTTTNTSQPSTPTHNNRLLAVQIQEQQQWSNPVLSPLLVKRMNETPNVVTSINIDDDEDPSASIDALVADVDSASHDLLDDQQNKSVDGSKSTTTALLNESHTNQTSPSPHLYLRSTSHILTTPPNPLASNDHPDNQLSVGNTFQKTFSPIHSAGFELNANNNVQISSSKTRTSFFTFDTNVLEQNELKGCLHDNKQENNENQLTKQLILNKDERTNIITTNRLNQDDNSNHSSTNSSSQNSTSRAYSQILQSTGETSQLSSTPPLSNDMKLSPKTSKSQGNISSLSPQHQVNRHFCNHPECSKVFANKSALAKHKLTHCQDRKHKCIKCNKGFKRLDHLHGHMLTHEEEKPHKCRVPDCNRTYCDARSLKRHIENAHQNILAAIHEGGHDEYKKFLPETAFVKTKEISNEFSADSNSPRSSSLDNDQLFPINKQSRSLNGNKIAPTYTFDEEKSIECHICKKSFKNGAALNGHMRLHGGFNDKQSPAASSSDSTLKKKRTTSPNNSERRYTKRKRVNSPTTSNDIVNHTTLMSNSLSIKNEEQDILMVPTPNTNNNIYQQTLYSTLPPCSDVLRNHPLDRSSQSRIRSISSSVIGHHESQLAECHIKYPMSVQPVTNYQKSNRKSIPFPAQFHDRNNNHPYPFDMRFNDDGFYNRINIPTNPANTLPIPNGILRFDHFNDSSIFHNVATIDAHDDKILKPIINDEALKYYYQNRQINSFSPSKHQPHPYFRSAPIPSHLPPAYVNPAANPYILQDFIRHKNGLIHKEVDLTRPEQHLTFDEPIHRTPATSPYAPRVYQSPSPQIVHSPAQRHSNITPSIINTPASSPYSKPSNSHCSPTSSIDISNNNPFSSTPIINSMQSSPSTNLSTSSSSNAAPKKRILSALKQEAQEEQQQNNQILSDYSPLTETNFNQDKQQIITENSIDDSPVSSSHKSMPDSTSPTNGTTKDVTSAFLIKTPSSTSTTTNSSTSSSSANKHFNYDNLSTVNKPLDYNSQSSFQWPSQVSQFRRQQSLNPPNHSSISIPSTPYTPPPMLSPFRKGSGLYYNVFIQPTPIPQSASTVKTPSLPVPTIPDEISGPKINIGEQYQATIPKFRSHTPDEYIDQDELLFSPSQLVHLDEQSLEKYEQLSRTSPLLFSPRQSPVLYPIELVYMLLHEYQGDLRRTLAALLDGTANDIKQCRPLHRYHFPECDSWTKEEIDAFTKGMETSEKNFILVSRAVGTKTVKQCIEFYYMPKVNLTSRDSASNSSLIKRKRLQTTKNRQQPFRQILDDDTSSSSLNEFRLDDDTITMISDNFSTAHFSCDIDDCLQTFTSERACRAHRNEHRRLKNNKSTVDNKTKTGMSKS